MFRIVRHPNGPRLYVLGLRLHHGAQGLALAVLGAVLMAHDRHDFPWSLFDPKGDTTCK